MDIEPKSIQEKPFQLGKFEFLQLLGEETRMHFFRKFNLEKREESDITWEEYESARFQALRIK